MNTQHAWGRCRLIFVFPALISPDRVPCRLFANYRRIFFLFLLFWFVRQSRCIPVRFPLFFERALATLYFYQPQLPPIGFVTGCLRFPSEFSSSYSSSVSFAVLVLYPSMLLAFCERDLAALSSAHVLSNMISSARDSLNSSSPPSN